MQSRTYRRSGSMLSGGGRVAGIGLALLGMLGACAGTTSSGGAGGGGGGVFPGDPCEVENDTQPCYPGSPVSRGLGECRDGLSTCLSGRWGDCEGYQLPVAESCNGLDDDCNGVTDDGCGGAGGGGGGPVTGLRLYHRDFESSVSSFVSQPVSELWSGPNAPPNHGILVAEGAYGTADAWLFVVADDGMLYVRQGAAWLAPQAVGTVFAGLDASKLNTLSVWQPNVGDPQTFQFTARSSGAEKLAYGYTVTLPGMFVSPDANNPFVIPDEADPDAPPHYMVDLDWSLAYQTAYLGTAHWVMFYMQCGADAYVMDGGNADFADLGPAGQSEVWGANPATGPVPGTVGAAWLEGTELYMIAP
jgi:hypothetical protein